MSYLAYDFGQEGGGAPKQQKEQASYVPGRGFRGGGGGGGGMGSLFGGGGEAAGAAAAGGEAAAAGAGLGEALGGLGEIVAFL